MDSLELVFTASSAASAFGQLAGLPAAAAQSWAALAALLSTIAAALLWLRWPPTIALRETSVDWLVPGGVGLFIVAAAVFGAIAAGMAGGGVTVTGVLALAGRTLWAYRDRVLELVADFRREWED